MPRMMALPVHRRLDRCVSRLCSRWSWALPALAVLAACRRPDPQDAAIAPPMTDREAPLVEFAGCSGASREPPEAPRCTLPAAPSVIHLWISATTVPVVEIDGAPADARSRPTIADEGWTVDVTLPETANAIVVRHADADASTKAWQLAIDRIPPSPTVDRLRQALPDFGARDRTPALMKAVDELDRQASTFDPQERHEALKLAMLVAYDAGATERSLGLGRRALREALDTGQLSHVIEIAEVLLHFTQDDAEKEWLLRLLEVSIDLAGDPQHLARLTYFRAHRANSRGDIGSSLDDAERSERVARRLGLVSDELVAVAHRTSLLALIGDTAGSDRAGDRILALVIGRSSLEACTDAQLLTIAARNLVWRRLLGDEAANPKPLLDRVAAYFEAGGGCDVGDNPRLQQALVEQRLHLANYALALNDPTTAREVAATIDRPASTPPQRRWLAYVEAELALRSGDAEGALRLTADFDRTAADQAFLSWKTALLRADARAALADADGALVEALAAESILDRAAGELAPDQGREGMAAAFQVSATRAVELQLGKGDLVGAAQTARRARARRLRPVGSTAAIASLDADERMRYHAARSRYQESSTQLADQLTEMWRLPADERARAARHHAELEAAMRAAAREADALLRRGTPAPSTPLPTAPGDVTLLYHPLPDGWVAFAITDHDIEAHRFAMPPDTSGEAASAELLLPFADAITQARMLRVLAVGELASTRFHTLPWNGEPLLMSKPVAYGLDLDGSPAAPLDRRAALVVADPATRISGLGRLPSAAAEGEAVGNRLLALGWAVRALAGESATHSDVLAELARADWLHYAGHGVSAGHTGWDSGLPLAGEALLDVSTIMSAARVPPAVVLSACETAGKANERGAGMQIATAFLLAGAEFVVAAQGGVDDDSAARFSTALYGAAGEDLRGPELMRNAALALRDAGEPMSTWSGFHVWVR
jgi:cellulose synthase operon protein C